MRNAALIAACAAILFGIGFNEFSQRREAARVRRDIAALSAEVEAARGEARAALAAVIAPETLSGASASVYLIVVNGAPRGTAFVIDRARGVLATAGHTAESLPLDDPKANVYILNRSLRRSIPVSRKQVHAGFGAFRQLVEAYQPTRKNTSIYAPQAAPIRDLALDAGLIFVDPVDPATGGNLLGPDLRIADEATLLALSPGSAIAIIGYPYDTLDDGFAADAGIPRIERGVIAAMTPPLDAAKAAPDPRIANLIIHRLSTAGGSSGSPVINADGEVVGIHTHGIESISSNADGAAQRADVIYDLLSPEREKRRMSELFVPAWSETLSYWARAVDVLPWSFFMEHGRAGVEPAPLVGSIDFDAPPPFDKEIRELKFGASVEEYRALAPDAPSTASSPAFLIKEPGQFAETTITVDRARETVLFAYDYSLRARSGACRITSYWRRTGETRLQRQSPRASFELRLPAEGPRTDEYRIVFRRDANCDPVSADFFAGLIQWDPEASVVAASFERPDEAPPSGTVARLAHAAQASMDRLIRCKLGKKDDPALCEEPQFISLEEP